MHTPEAIQARAATRYESTWRDQLLVPGDGACSFPLNPPGARAIEQDPAAVGAWIRTWRSWHQRHPQVSLRSRDVRTAFGGQPVFTHLDVPGIAELAALNGHTSVRWARAAARWELIGARADPATVRPWLAQIMDLDEHDFGLLQVAAEWFRRNPRSGYTIRRVPVPGMHTKWLARHRRLVIALLGGSAPQSADGPGDPLDPQDLPADELDILGLKPLPREVDILLLDQGCRAQAGGLRQLRAPVDEVARLPLRPRNVLVVENKEAALPLDDRDGLVVIHSLGNHLDVLGQIPWISCARLWYWGDLDRSGFTLLSRARRVAPGAASLLMDPASVREHRQLAVTEHIARLDAPEPTLTPSELEALALLAVRDGYLRIEQERIPSRAVGAALDAQLA